MTKVSRFRKEIMGAAIILILLCHSYLPKDNTTTYEVLDFIRLFSQVGVDMFLFLSGYGLFYSFEKSHEMLSFHKKRFAKILVPFAIVFFMVLCAAAWFHNDLAMVAYAYSPVSLLETFASPVWFVWAILLLYLVFPLYYYILEQNEQLFKVIIALFCIVPMISAVGIECKIIPYRVLTELFIVRIPSFMLGMYVAKNEDGFHKTERTLLLFSAISVFVITMDRLVFYDKHTLCVTIMRVCFLPLSCCIIQLLVKALQRNKTAWVERMLGFLGGRTLELYLVHETVLSVVKNIFSEFCVTNAYALNAVSILISIGVASGVWTISQPIVGKIANKKGK